MSEADRGQPNAGAVWRWVRRLGLALAAALLALWLAAGFYTVEPNEQGVVLRFGRFQSIARPGIHYALPWPIDRVYTPSITDVKRIEVGFKTLGKLSSEPRRSDVLTGDENILKVMMVVQYKIDDPVEYLLAVEDPDWLVERAVESAMSARIASLGVDDALTTAKATIQIEAIATAQKWLNSYNAGIVLLGGNLQEVVPPVPVGDAFKEVTDAKKDADRAKDEARGYTNTVVPEARGKARRIVKQAEGYYSSRVNRAQGEAARFLSLLEEYRKAKQITRTRLFLDAVQDVFSQAETLILDTDDQAGPTKLTIVEER